jgi:hypothetical protein
LHELKYDDDAAFLPRRETRPSMKFGIFYEHQLPRPK